MRVVIIWEHMIGSGNRAKSVTVNLQTWDRRSAKEWASVPKIGTQDGTGCEAGVGL